MIYELMVLWQLVFLPVERYCGKYAVRCSCVCLTNCPGHNSHEELIKGRISEIGAEVVFRGCCFGFRGLLLLRVYALGALVRDIVRGTFHVLHRWWRIRAGAHESGRSTGASSRRGECTQHARRILC